MTIAIEEETKVDFDFDYKRVIEAVINQAMDYKNCPYEAEVSVTLTDNDSIHAINKEFRNIDNPTDVLSFPLVEYEEAGQFDFLEDRDDCFNPESGMIHLLLKLRFCFICVKAGSKHAAGTPQQNGFHH